MPPFPLDGVAVSNLDLYDWARGTSCLGRGRKFGQFVDRVTVLLSVGRTINLEEVGQGYSFANEARNAEELACSVRRRAILTVG